MKSEFPTSNEKKVAREWEKSFRVFLSDTLTCELDFPYLREFIEKTFTGLRLYVRFRLARCKVSLIILISRHITPSKTLTEFSALSLTVENCNFALFWGKIPTNNNELNTANENDDSPVGRLKVGQLDFVQSKRVSKILVTMCVTAIRLILILSLWNNSRRLAWQKANSKLCKVECLVISECHTSPKRKRPTMTMN